MSATRAVRPTDLVALVSFDGRVYPNEARTWDQLGTPPEAPSILGTAVEQWFSFATGRHTWISIHGQTIRGLVSARRRGSRAAWEVDCLIAADDDAERVALDLFDQLSAGAVRGGAHKIFLRLEAGSNLIAPARAAGFVPYTTEAALSLSEPTYRDEPLADGLSLRPRERSDDHGLFQLYNRTAPSAVRMIEATTFTEWQAATERRSGGRGAADVVGLHDGKIVAWLRTAHNGPLNRIDVVADPQFWPQTPGLIAWAINNAGATRPIVAAVPGYARPLAERLGAVGFTPAGEFELLAKRLAQPVRVGKPVRATVKAVPTV